MKLCLGEAPVFGHSCGGRILLNFMALKSSLHVRAVYKIPRGLRCFMLFTVSSPVTSPAIFLLLLLFLGGPLLSSKVPSVSDLFPKNPLQLIAANGVTRSLHQHLFMIMADLLQRARQWIQCVLFTII